MRESDDRPELPLARPASTLPVGSKNYLTAGGAAKLRDDLAHLVAVERPRLVAAADDPDAKRQLLALNHRVVALEESLRSAEIVEIPETERKTVLFGATVRVRHASGEESTYRIVGVDEMDLECGWITWQAPTARALMNRKLGEQVRFKFPSGEEQLEIIGIDYDAGC